MITNITYSDSEATAAKASCPGVNSGPAAEVVNRGSTRVSVESAMTVASIEPVPSGLKGGRWLRNAPTTSERPTMPLTVIITAAKTVSRARPAVSPPPLTIRVTMSATSITVTATASTSDPNGSPTRWATTSAWWTAASTAPISTTATRASTRSSGLRPHVTTRARKAASGTTTVQPSRPRTTSLTMG